MRILRFGLTCTAATCAAGAAMATLTNCEDSTGTNNASFDGSTAKFDGTAPPAPTGTTPVADAGPDAADAAPGCAPASMAGFVPPAYVHANSQTFDCPNHEGKYLTDVCFGDASTVAACEAFPDAGVPDGGPLPPNCNACLRTGEVPVDGGGYGPFIRGVVTVPNVAGCVEIADQSDAGVSCAVAIQAAAVCVDRACRPSCPVTNEASRDAYVACTKAAAVGTCSTFALSAAACANAAIDAGGTAAQFCFSSANPVVQFEKIAAYFCTS